MAVEYDSSAIFINSAKTDKESIARIDAVIDALYTTVLKAAETGNIEEYTLNDGQVKINTIYRNPKEVTATIQALQVFRQKFVNSLNGRVFRLTDGKNLTGR